MIKTGFISTRYGGITMLEEFKKFARRRNVVDLQRACQTRG